MRLLNLSLNPKSDNNVEHEFLEIKHVNLDFGASGRWLDVNLTLEANKGYLITGSHEKSNLVLLKIAGGMLPPYPESGQVFFRGNDIYESNDDVLNEIKKKISYVFSDGIMISNLTIRENLLLPYLYHYPKSDSQLILEKIMYDLDFLGIPHYFLEKRPSDVSYEIKKKLSFIRATIMDPELIFLDKPLFNLDDQYRENAMLYLESKRKMGASFVITGSHHPLLDPLIDDFIILEKGQPPAIKPITR